MSSLYQSKPDPEYLDANYSRDSRVYRPYGDDELSDVDALSDSNKASKSYMLGINYTPDASRIEWRSPSSLPPGDDDDDRPIRRSTPRQRDGRFGYALRPVPLTDQQKQFASLGIGFTSLICETVLSHPCIVLRRQCQIRSDSQRYHLTPFSPVPVFFQITKNQGFGALWKGIGSVFIVRGILLFSETAISEFTPLPKDVTTHSSLKKYAQHLFLKSLSWAICTPFYAASLVETVQSEVASERPGVLDVLREGLNRILVISAPVSRLLPLWRFILPTVALGVGHYALRGVVQATTHQILIGEDRFPLQQENEMEPEECYEQYFAELVSNFVGSFIADVAWFPLETLVHRLAVQGTRTLVDNTDTGLEVAPVGYAYDGFVDALRTILRDETMAGLYKGFGCLVLQFGLHLLILRMTKFAFEQLMLNGQPVRRSRGVGSGHLPFPSDRNDLSRRSSPPPPTSLGASLEEDMQRKL